MKTNFTTTPPESNDSAIRQKGSLPSRLVLVIGGIVFMIGGLQTLAWGLGWTSILMSSGTTAYLAPSTAFCLVLLGGFLILQSREPDRDLASALVANATVGLIAATNLTLHLANASWDLDKLIWGQDIVARMSEATSICFLLAVSGFLVRKARIGAPSLFPAILASAGLSITILVIISFLFNSNTLYRIPIFSHMSIWTATSLALFFTGKLCLHPEENWTGLLTGDQPGSRLARNLLPLVFGGPLIITWITVQLGINAHMQPSFVASIVIFVMTIVLSMTVLYISWRENRAFSAQKLTMTSLERTVRERDNAIREIHHRVKNNLQQISALLHIHALRTKTDASRAPLDAMIHRIDAMGVVQKLLLQSDDVTSLNARDFLPDLCENLASAFGADIKGVSLTCQSDDIDMGLDAAMSVGLLVNELVVNAFKYAFETLNDENKVNESPRFINVSFMLNANHAQLVIKDNGVGLSRNNTDIDIVSAEGAGSMIIEGLADDLNAEIEKISSNGLSVIVSIPREALEAKT